MLFSELATSWGVLGVASSDGITNIAGPDLPQPTPKLFENVNLTAMVNIVTPDLPQPTPTPTPTPK